jgi:hypothetical protein
MYSKLILIISLTMRLSSPAVITTKKTTISAPWLQLVDNIIGCYGGRNKFFQVFSNSSIDTTLPNFFDYFSSLKTIKNVENAKFCCSKCGANGANSKCIGFDYNEKTKTCQLYSVLSEEVYYIEDGNKFYYTLYHGQAEFLNGYNNDSINYIVPQSNRYSGVFVDGTGDYKLIY